TSWCPPCAARLRPLDGGPTVPGDRHLRDASSPATAGGRASLAGWDRTTPAVATGTGPPAVPHRRQVTAALVMGISAVAVDLMIVANAVPLIARDLGALDAVGWLFSVNLLCQTM